MKKIHYHLESIGNQLFLIAFAAALFFITLYFRQLFNFVLQILHYLSPLFTGIAVAYVLNIPMCKIESFIKKYFKKEGFIDKHSRVLAIILAVLFVLILFSLIMIFVLPELVSSIVNLFSNLGNYSQNLRSYLNDLAKTFGLQQAQLDNLDLEKLLVSFGLDYHRIINSASSWLVGTGSGVLEHIYSAGTSIFNFLMASLLALYFLSSKEKFLSQIKMVIDALLSDKQAQIIYEQARDANSIFRNFVGTRFLDIFILFILVYILMYLIGLPYALLISTICAIFTIVPIFGSLVAEIISIFLLFTLNPWYALVFYILHQIVLNVDTNFIYPRFAGKSIGLPAVWILVSVLVAGYIGGPIYMLMAVPVTACIYSFFARFIKAKLELKNKLKEENDLAKTKKEA